jgi:hypothetical protein
MDIELLESNLYRQLHAEIGHIYVGLEAPMQGGLGLEGVFIS